MIQENQESKLSYEAKKDEESFAKETFGPTQESGGGGRLRSLA